MSALVVKLQRDAAGGSVLITDAANDMFLRQSVGAEAQEIWKSYSLKPWGKVFAHAYINDKGQLELGDEVDE